MCRSQQVREKMEGSEKSEIECNLIREDFGWCSDFEIMSIQPHIPEGEKTSRYVKERIEETNKPTKEVGESEKSKNLSSQRFNVKQAKVTQG